MTTTNESERQRLTSDHLFFAASGRILQTEKRILRRFLRRLPEFDDLEYNYCGVGNRNPNADSLNWQPGPSSNAQAHHLLRLIIPPLIGHSQCSFPVEPYQKDAVECEAEGTPGN